MNFLTPLMAWAALFLAAAPLIIQLLNRRRFTIVDWAAMDFLREAMQRQRRILRLRDIILLILRTLCVLLFGLAIGLPMSLPGVWVMRDRVRLLLPEIAIGVIAYALLSNLGARIAFALET